MTAPISGCACTCGPVQQSPVQQHAAGASMAAPAMAGHMGHGHDFAPGAAGQGPGVREPQRAQEWLQYLRGQAMRWANFSDAAAAGYKRNPSSGNDPVQHYIHDGAFKAGDPNNFQLPATLMYRHNGDGSKTLVGLMISAKPGAQLPDFGAGAWHRHPGDDYRHMHIWFDRTVAQGAFENNTGVI